MLQFPIKHHQDNLIIFQNKSIKVFDPLQFFMHVINIFPNAVMYQNRSWIIFSCEISLELIVTFNVAYCTVFLWLHSNQLQKLQKNCDILLIYFFCFANSNDSWFMMSLNKIKSKFGNFKMNENQKSNINALNNHLL